MDECKGVPVADIYKDNIRTFYPSLLCAIQNSVFIGLDLELSGLGDRKKLCIREIDFRYAAMAEVARTRSILSLGLSCFKKLPPDQSTNSSNDNSEEIYLAHTYNIVLLCDGDYVIESDSAKFLVTHGFDFNKQYSLGVPYYKGNDKLEEDISADKDLVRNIISFIIKNSIPIVVHNGFIDLVFLYHHFWAVLPQSLAIFLADLTEMFPNGVYDTKYIADFQARLPASYLEFVFKKAQRENHESSNTSNPIKVVFPTYSDAADIKYISHERKASSTVCKDEICNQYSQYGWCPNGFNCSQSHDVDLFIDNNCEVEVSKSDPKKKKRHRNKDAKSKSQKQSNDEAIQVNASFSDDKNSTNNSSINGSDNSDLEIEDINQKQEKNGVMSNKNISEIGHLGHLAGFDSYMTAFTFSFYISKYRRLSNSQSIHDDSSESCESSGMEKWKNKLSLSGKDLPLTIIKSSFSKTSKQHRQKFDKLNTSTNGINHN